MVKFLAAFFVLICVSFTEARAENWLTLTYSAKAGDSLKSIILYFLEPGLPHHKANKTLKMTMYKNPDIKVWNPLTNDAVFKIYFDPTIVNAKRFKEYYFESKKKSAHHLSISSIPSIGYFSQSNATGFTVKYNQISFFSLGVNYTYAPLRYNLSFNGSVYYSTISAATNQINGANSSVSIPGEYGVTLYGTFFPRDRISYYTGIDYESFSSFNLENITVRNTVSVDNNSAIYLTAGLNFRPAFARKLMFKTSISKSLITNNSSAANATREVDISGYKILFFVNYMLNEKWSTHAMFKSHNFSGDNELSINRFGLGVGYSFF